MNPKTTHPARRPSETFAYRGAEWHRKSLGGTGLLYDGDNVIADLDGSTVSRFYVTPMLDQNVSMTIASGDQAGSYWYSQDERQSVRILTDSAGAVVNRYDYTVFGEPWAPGTTESVVQRYEHTGRELASESNEYYFRYRVYGPALGQFFTRDPLGYVDGMGLYGGYFAGTVGLDGYGRRKALEFSYTENQVKYDARLGNNASWKPDMNIACSCDPCGESLSVGYGPLAQQAYAIEGKWALTCEFTFVSQITLPYKQDNPKWIDLIKANQGLYEKHKDRTLYWKEALEGYYRRNIGDIHDAVLHHENTHQAYAKTWYTGRYNEVQKVHGQRFTDQPTCETERAAFVKKVSDDWDYFRMWNQLMVHEFHTAVAEMPGLGLIPQALNAAFDQLGWPDPSNQ